MNEELDTQVTEVEEQENQEEKTSQEEVGYTEVEQRAIEMGWRPKDDFDGDETDFIDAQEFVRRKPLFDKIETVGRELKETRKALKALQIHHENVKEAEYKHALETLRMEKKVALEEGDADKLVAIDEKIQDAKLLRAEQLRQEKTETKQQEPHPNFVLWVDKNKWYQTDPSLREEADLIGAVYASKHPDISPDKLLDYVGDRIRKMYPDKFKNPNKSRPSAVEGSSSNKSAGSSNRSDDDDIVLSDDEKKVMNRLVRQGVLTKEQYLADIRKVRGQ